MNIMNEQMRRPEQISPKSSPRGSVSPAYQRPDSSGTLKTTISLGKVPSVLHSGPFYLMKEMPISEKTEITGCTNLVEFNGLEHTYNKFCNKKGKEELSAFLPHLPGYIDAPGIQDNSSLHSLIEKPPIVGKEILPLTNSALTSFRLHPGPLPEQYRFMSQMPTKKKHKHKRKRESGTNGALQETTENASDAHDKPAKHKKTGKTEESSAKEPSGKKESGRKRKKNKKKKGKDKDEDPMS
ncbi:mediator of RNA polymerase II transcription subunit 19-like [Ruditapes philippinarum]|uniref:mediator of RNA polymerase II transcription subunit 19-like n=1 Tax=Ruditapes philippinarum TaxID=129788 RepID=UPI00295BCCF3|nr:mediator of RNA polymerase II transcription subunit 19-like [Ruditapes philippinarum]